jgi:hypothetical protein
METKNKVQAMLRIVFAYFFLEVPVSFISVISCLDLTNEQGPIGHIGASRWLHTFNFTTIAMLRSEIAYDLRSHYCNNLI